MCVDVCICVLTHAGTPADELEHLESVLGRVSQLHVAEKKPAQLPDAGDVSELLHEQHSLPKCRP